MDHLVSHIIGTTLQGLTHHDQCLLNRCIVIRTLIRRVGSIYGSTPSHTQVWQDKSVNSEGQVKRLLVSGHPWSVNPLMSGERGHYPGVSEVNVCSCGNDRAAVKVVFMVTLWDSARTRSPDKITDHN